MRRPRLQSARCRPQAIVPANGGDDLAGVGWSRAGRTRAWSASNRRRHRATDRRHVAGRIRRPSSGRGECPATAGGVTPPIAGAWPGGPDDSRPGGGVPLIAGGVISPIAGTRPGGSYDCRPGGGPVHHLTVRRPVSRTGFTDCHPGGGPSNLIAGVVSLPSAGPTAGLALLTATWAMSRRYPIARGVSLALGMPTRG